PSDSAYRNQVFCPNARSITSCQPDRWKKVASGQVWTKRSQRGRSSGCINLTLHGAATDCGPPRCSAAGAIIELVELIASSGKCDPCGPIGNRAPVPSDVLPSGPD